MTQDTPTYYVWIGGSSLFSEYFLYFCRYIALMAYLHMN